MAQVPYTSFYNGPFAVYTSPTGMQSQVTNQPYLGGSLHEGDYCDVLPSEAAVWNQRFGSNLFTGRYRLDRAPLAAVAISDVSHMSCVSNDLSYEEVFSRYLQAHGRSGDCLVALTTSGTSRNVIRAVHTARQLGMRVVLLSGRVNAELEGLCDVYLCTPGGKFADRVQELHIKILHILIELIERRLFPGNYASSTA